MERPNFQMSVTGMLGVVACVAFNVWLFRIGPLLGILGLNVTKHVVIAYLCKVVGVNRRAKALAALSNDFPAGVPPEPEPA